VILRTRDSLYEVREGEKRFRKLTPGAASDGQWSSYDRLSPVSPGEPVRFFVVQDERRRVLDYRIITTSPVVEVLPASA
jgi:hypothetical protein